VRKTKCKIREQALCDQIQKHKKANLCSEKEVLEETGHHYRQVETTVHCQIDQIEKLPKVAKMNDPP
jgi:hypothetical protein